MNICVLKAFFVVQAIAIFERVKFSYSPILNYACEVINYVCISFVY